MSDYEDREFWLWMTQGDYTCSDCTEMPLINLDEPDQHDECDCVVMSITLPGRLAPQAVSTDSEGTVVKHSQSLLTVPNVTENDIEVEDDVEVSYDVGTVVWNDDAAAALGIADDLGTETDSVSITATVPPGKRLVFNSAVTTEDFAVSADLCYYYDIPDYGEQGPICAARETIANQVVLLGIEVTPTLEDL